ncbi:MAG: CinA family protein [Pseudomonadota bacterium]
MSTLVTPIVNRIANTLIERKQTVAISESAAGGLIAAQLLAVPGASRYFLGGGVVYTRQSRSGLLGIADAQMSGIRSASEPYATLCAQTIRDSLSATWGLAETGAAGPTGNRYGDAAGHACVAVAGPTTGVRTIETGMDDREANMWAFAEAALTLLEERLQAAT